MLSRLAGGLIIGLAAGVLSAQSGSLVVKKATTPAPPKFAPAVPLKIEGAKIRVDEPGYAAPCVADVTGDGIADLLVGQFAEGRIKVYAGRKQGGFGKGAWLMADGKIASVPGVW